MSRINFRLRCRRLAAATASVAALLVVAPGAQASFTTYMTAGGRSYYPSSLVCSAGRAGVSVQSFMATTNDTSEYVGVFHWLYRWNGSNWVQVAARPQVYGFSPGQTVSYESRWIYGDGSSASIDPAVTWTVSPGYYKIMEQINWYRGRDGVFLDYTKRFLTGGSGGEYCSS